MRTRVKENEAAVHVVPYDPAWPARFESERALLSALLGAWLVGSIEHIGSTAVPGLAAKPVIDIMAPVRELDSSRPALAALSSLEYVYYPYRPDVMHWLCKPSPSIRSHHLHLVPFRSALWHERLAFRDALRADAQLAAEYAVLKQRLAKSYPFDREAYSDAKMPFVERVLRDRQAKIDTDANAVHAYARDRDVTRYLQWQPHASLSDTQAFLALLLVCDVDSGALEWIIQTRTDGVAIGMISPHRKQGFKAELGYVQTVLGPRMDAGNRNRSDRLRARDTGLAPRARLLRR